MKAAISASILVIENDFYDALPAPADPPLSPRKAILNPLLILKLCCSQSFLPLSPSLSLGHGGSHFDYEKAVPSVR